MTTIQKESIEDRAAELLYRVTEFRRWMDTNVLFPIVADTLVKPAMADLRAIESALVGVLYAHNAVDKIAAISKTLAKP